LPLRGDIGVFDTDHFETPGREILLSGDLPDNE